MKQTTALFISGSGIASVFACYRKNILEMIPTKLKKNL